MRIRNVGGLLSALLVLAGAAPAQPGGPAGMERQQDVFVAATGFPAGDSTAARVDVVYRIDNEFFVPVRVADSSIAAPYLRSGEILIELFDSAGVSAAREIRQITIPDDRAEAVPGERPFHEGLVSFTVPPGRYRVFVETTDRQSQRRHVHPSSSVRAPGTDRGSLTLYPVFFVSQPAGDRLRVDSFGAGMLFSAPRHLLLAFLLPEDTLGTAGVSYRISLADRQDKPGGVKVADTLAGVPLITGKALNGSRAGEPPQYVLAEDPGSRVAYIALPLKTEALPLRTYQLTLIVSVGGRTATLEHRFRNFWPEMPQSLKNPDAAFDALRFITTGGQLDSLRRGDFEQRLDNLERFWADKDKTPGTALNEVMAEYYRRVDHAQQAFTTLRERDGTKSDRGRVYILYGPPTRAERSLQPSGGHREIWFYERSGRRFTFVDEQRNGTYTLLPPAP